MYSSTAHLQTGVNDTPHPSEAYLYWNSTVVLCAIDDLNLFFSMDSQVHDSIEPTRAQAQTQVPMTQMVLSQLRCGNTCTT